MTELTCKVCGCEGPHPDYQAREMHFGTQESFAYFQCVQCKCLQIAEIPPEMSLYYPGNYYSTLPVNDQKHTGFRGRFRLKCFAANLFRRSVFEKFLAFVRPNRHAAALAGLRLTMASRVLDVGCGNGSAFAYPLKEIGFQTVAGCDPFLGSPLTYSNGLQLHQKALADMTEGVQWDVISFHHSFEHLPNPAETLNAVSRRLSPGGVCLLRVPTSSSYAWEHYGLNWVQLDAPRHLYLHSRESIQLLAERTGFEVERITYDADEFQFWGSDNYVNGVALKDQKKRGKHSKLAWLFVRSKLKWKTAQLNRQLQGDQAAFVLRKRG